MILTFNSLFQNVHVNLYWNCNNHMSSFIVLYSRYLTKRKITITSMTYLSREVLNVCAVTSLVKKRKESGNI